MDQAQVEDALRQIITKNSGLPVKSIAADDSLAEDLGFDSFAFLMALSEVEDRFGVEFPVDRVDDLRVLSFRGLVRIVQDVISRKQECMVYDRAAQQTD